MENLRIRAQRFLETPPPFDNFVPDNLTDGFIRRYVYDGPWDDPELIYSLRLCYVLAAQDAERSVGEIQKNDLECAEILRGILLEIYGPKSIEGLFHE